jgi:hypothetical protein
MEAGRRGECDDEDGDDHGRAIEGVDVGSRTSELMLAIRRAATRSDRECSVDPQRRSGPTSK